MAKQTNYRNVVIKHLEEWKKDHFPNVGDGIFRGKKYAHILPLTECSQVEAVENCNLMKDVDKEYLQRIKVHQYAHHLNSSQILCVNFFGSLLGESVNYGVWKAKPRLIEFVKQLVGIDLQVDKAKCQFEYLDGISKHKENTNFDFHISDGTYEIFFEIKYTEDGFGKAKRDNRHETKFNKLYKPLLDNWLKPTEEKVDMVKFLDFYQIFRNIVRSGEHKYVVFLYPEQNKICQKTVESFQEEFPKILERPHILFRAWEKQYEYMSKDFKEKYFPKVLS